MEQTISAAGNKHTGEHLAQYLLSATKLVSSVQDIMTSCGRLVNRGQEVEKELKEELDPPWRGWVHARRAVTIYAGAAAILGPPAAGAASARVGAGKY